MVCFIYRDEVYNKDTEEKGIAESSSASSATAPSALQAGFPKRHRKFFNTGAAGLRPRRLRLPVVGYRLSVDSGRRTRAEPADNRLRFGQRGVAPPQCTIIAMRRALSSPRS